jgi:hypothetical protein
LEKTSFNYGTEQTAERRISHDGPDAAFLKGKMRILKHILPVKIIDTHLARKHLAIYWTRRLSEY